MPMTREPIDVRVSEGILRFGARSVPLRTVRRATTTELEPDRRATVRAYALNVAKWLIPAAVVAFVSPEAVEALVNLVALIWFTISTVRLAGHLRLTLHELTVETTTGTHRVLLGTDPRALAEIAFRITDAIQDPTVEFHLHAQTIHHTDTRPNPRAEDAADAAT